MKRLCLAATALAVLAVALLMAPLTAGAEPNDRFSAAIAPRAVQPPGLGTYTISITNQPNSSDATQGSIQIPIEFVVDGVVNPPTAAIVSGPCAGNSWDVSLSPTSIDVTAPAGGAALCDRGTLAVSFAVLAAPLGDGLSTWLTTLSAGGQPFQAQSQPTLTIDGTPPDTTIQGSPPAFTGAQASFSFSGSDPGGSGVASFSCKLDDNPFSPCMSPASYTGLTDGDHAFLVRATDAAGNVDSTPASVVWTADVTPPETTLQGDPPDPRSRSAGFAFGGSDASSGVAGFQCRLDGGSFTSCTSGITYADLPDGEHSFEVRAVDLVGNLDPSPAARRWTIDATPPPPPTITSAPSDPSGLSEWTFTFADADVTAGFRCRLDGSAFGDCSDGAFSTGSLDDGSHSFGVEAVDPAGNESGVTTYDWTVDTVHPLVAVTDAPPLLTNRMSASFSFFSNKPGSTYECRLDGGAFTACVSPRLYSSLANGSHTFGVRAIALGLVGLTTEYTWVVDTVAPQTTIGSKPPANDTSASARFSFASTEPGSTFTCSVDVSGFGPCTSPKAYAGLGDGAHTFRVQATDRAGNSDASPAAYAWRISGVGPPTVDLTPPQDVRRLKRNVSYGVLQLRWRGPVDADFDHVAVFVGTNPSSPPRTPVYTGRAQTYVNRRFKNGLYYRYLVVSYDHASNASRGASVIVRASALLTSPRAGATVRRAPVFRWSPVRGASFYNIQLYYRGSKVLSAWPGKARQILAPRWTYGGHSFSLRKGTYAWYVWPGFGPRARSHYGQLVGQATFRVR